ncbi:DUF6600 domain-containing protein [Sandarakinorhabdus sp. AAP62]|uniref:DUF6600 domain-containing protein n=1 Tax=Sandarakinorhabdus sp. AAP62 TaxID=1248916 RepID=UPI0003068C14|nr:DUF6600 domain-containing protein [Sandarakinorhabdus sp. AAP62]
MSLPRSVLLLLAATLAGCAYPDYASGVAPSYPSGYQPVMGGYATDWPAQPGAQWGPEDVPSIDVFRQPLSLHGRWLQSPQWGLVFVPNAPNGWRPYQNGQWLENRFWLSADPWGWATDHYGRWGFDEAVGWVWVPDVTWGPSWVAWREADDVVGWAPIPPRVSWNVGFGFGSGWGYDSWNSWYGPSWVWVPRGNLYARGFGGRIYPWNTGANWWGRSRWQHAPYWGWNQPWDRNWGWRAPGHGGNRGWNGNNGWNRGWSGGNRNNPGWNNPGWNNGRRSDDRRWDNRGDGWRGEPRRGQPGSVGDRIGRDLTGQPQPGWNGNQPRGGWNRDGQRRDGVQPGVPGGWNGGNQGNWRADGRPPRVANENRGDGGWNGRRDGVSDRVAGGMALPSPPQPQAQPRAPRQNWGAGNGQPRPEYRPQARSEPRPEPRRAPVENGGQRGNDHRSYGENNEHPR